MNQITVSYLMKITAFLEFSVATIPPTTTLSGATLLAANLMGDLIRNSRVVDLNQVLGDALALVAGIEFIKMPVKHIPGAVVEALLSAIVREMVATHAGSAEALMGVITMGIILLIRRYHCFAKTAGTERGKEVR